MRGRFGRLFVLASVLAAPCASAHDTWLAARAPAPNGIAWTLELTTGHDFPTLESAPPPSRIARAERIAAAGRLPLLPLAARREAQPFRVLAGDDAVLVGVVELRPRIAVLDEAEVARYLAGELGEAPALVERHRRLGRWRERFAKYAKALLRAQSRTDPAALATRVHGLGYELVPQRDPTLPLAGEPLRVCAYADGAAVRDPYVPLRIGIVQSDGDAGWQLADADGCAAFVPETAGGYLLRSVLIRPLDSPGADWDSRFATLTVGPSPPASNVPTEEHAR